MSSLNKVQLIGRVGKDPDVRNMQSGDKVASFSVATSERWKNKAGERQEKTSWHNIVIFNQHLVSLVDDYVSKGDLIYLEGALETRKWEKDGVAHYTTEVVLKNFGGQIVLLGSSDNGEEEDETPAPKTQAADAFEDEIPF